MLKARARDDDAGGPALIGRREVFLSIVLLVAAAQVACDVRADRAASGPKSQADADPASHRAQATKDAAEDRMRMTIGRKTFNVTLEENPTVAKLKALLPLTANMTELNGNEKYYHLHTRLPTGAVTPRTIRNGDLMLYGDNSLVLFYKTFETSYSYTRLGRIDDPSDLSAAVGSGDVSVTFALE
jgi:hypothetical protein